MIARSGAHRAPSISLAVLGALFALLAFGLALLPLKLVCGTIGGAGIVLLAVIDPIWAACWAILSVPVQELVHLPGGATVTQVMLLIAIAAWGLRVLAYPQRAVRFGAIALPLALLLAALTTSSLFSPYSPFDGFKETLRWAWVLLIYLVVVNHATDRWRAVLVLACLLLAPAADALLGLWQFVTAAGPPSFGIAGGRFVRAYGTIGQPNSFAGYMNMAWPLAVAAALGLWQRKPGQRSRASDQATHFEGLLRLFGSPFATICAIILLAALFASFSRGGWVGAIGGAAGLGLATLVQPRSHGTQNRAAALLQRWMPLLLLGALGIVVIVVLGAAGLLPAAAVARLDSITANLRLFDVRTVQVTPDNFAVVERMAHIQAGWGMFTTHPVLGVGPGNFTLAYPTFAIPPWYISQGHAHNYYLHIAAEAGIVGAVLYLVLLVAIIRQALRALRSTSDFFWRMVAIGGCGMIAAMMLHNVFENLHVLNLPLQLGAVWGLLVVAEQQPSIATSR